jgi:hypothetical protein
MGVEKLPSCLVINLLDRFQCGPGLQKLVHDLGIQGIKPGSYVGKIALEDTRETVQPSCSVMHQFPALLHEKLQGTRLFIVRPPWSQLIPVLTHEFQGELRIAWIILGPAGGKGFTTFREGPGIHRIEVQELLLQQYRDQAPFGWL